MRGKRGRIIDLGVRRGEVSSLALKLKRNAHHGFLVFRFFFFQLSIRFYRDAEVQRLDAKVIVPLSQYATICRHARDDVKNTFAARDRELTRRRHLDKVRERNPRNRQMIVSLRLKPRLDIS